MADIDKALPNVETEIKVPGEEEIVEAQQETIDESLEEQLVFVGLIAMIDPPRPEVSPAIQTCKQAGINIVMITGDYKETAIAIAKELGLADEQSQALNGAELEEIDQASFAKMLHTISVYARVTVEQKMRIVKAWKEHFKA